MKEKVRKRKRIEESWVYIDDVEEEGACQSTIQTRKVGQAAIHVMSQYKAAAAVSF